MTLIAALEMSGLPVLIGDLFLSSDLGHCDPENIVSPLVRDLSRSKIVGTSQKLVIIHPKVVFAWTGSAFFARSIIRRLRAFTQSGEQVTYVSLLDFINSIRADYYSLDYIVYCLEEGGYGHITSLAPFEIEPFSRVILGGSGTEWAFNRLNTAGGAIFTPSQNAYTNMAGKALAIIAQSTLEQVAFGSGIREGWGGGFECVVVNNDNCFEKLDRILWLFGTVNASASGNNLSILQPYVFQRCVGNDSHFLVDDGSICDYQVVTPPDEPSPSEFELPSIIAPYFVIICILGPEGHGVFCDMYHPDSIPAVHISRENGTIITIDYGFIQRLNKALPEIGVIETLTVW